MNTFVLATHSFGTDRLTARVDYFNTRDRTWQARDNNNEKGFATTLAWRRDINPHIAIFTEAMHVTSERFARAYQGLPKQQAQLVFQSSVRLMY